MFKAESLEMPGLMYIINQLDRDSSKKKPPEKWASQYVLPTFTV